MAPRIAILGICLESNAFAPEVTDSDFGDYAYCRGEEIFHSCVISNWIGSRGKGGFVGRMDELREWTPVGILVADAQSGGPCHQSTYTNIKQEMMNRLSRELPVDAVYIMAHGAGLTTELDDLDGDYFKAVRCLVGEDTPIVATLDLHANVSDDMVEFTDALISQRTNPHMDSTQRAEEAAELLHLMLAGERFYKHLIRLPLVTPQVSQLTASGTPYGQILDYAQNFVGTHLISVSVMAGFAFSDTGFNGMAIYVLGKQHEKIKTCAQAISRKAWKMRKAFTPNLISLEQAVHLAKKACSSSDDSPLIFADVADNPGGGGGGDTMWLLQRFYEEGLKDIYVGIIHDPVLVDEAWGLGEGARFRACFNRSKTSEFARRFEVDAEILLIKDGDYKSTVGIYKGARVPLGKSCVLRLEGLIVVVVSVRQQLLGYDCFEHFGLDVMRASALIVKSRGHFRAGFEGMVRSRNIYEVDVPGLTTPNLNTVKWQRLSRPIFPLDFDTVWP